MDRWGEEQVILQQRFSETNKSPLKAVLFDKQIGVVGLFPVERDNTEKMLYEGDLRGPVTLSILLI